MQCRLAGLLISLSLLMVATTAASAQDYKKGDEAYAREDYATAFKEFSALAKQGYARAQFTLGVMYNNANGVTQNYREAVKWYRLAAEQGYGKAQTNLGMMYYFGHGVLQDNIYAYMWTNIGASKETRKYDRGLMIRDDIKKRLTASQLEKAQQLARECVARNYKGC